MKLKPRAIKELLEKAFAISKYNLSGDELDDTIKITRSVVKILDYSKPPWAKVMSPSLR